MHGTIRFHVNGHSVYTEGVSVDVQGACLTGNSSRVAQTGYLLLGQCKKQKMFQIHAGNLFCLVTVITT